MSIETNVLASQEFEDIERYIDYLSKDIRIEVQRKLQEKYTVKWKDCEPVGPMNDQEAREFENTGMRIAGMHWGKSIHEVPHSYLIWLTESNQDFLAELRRYLKSDRFARVQA